MQNYPRSSEVVLESGGLIVANSILGGSLVRLYNNIPPSPILLLKALQPQNKPRTQSQTQATSTADALASTKAELASSQETLGCELHMGVSHNTGTVYWGAYNKDPILFGVLY